MQGSLQKKLPSYSATGYTRVTQILPCITRTQAFVNLSIQLIMLRANATKKLVWGKRADKNAAKTVVTFLGSFESVQLPLLVSSKISLK